MSKPQLTIFYLISTFIMIFVGLAYGASQVITYFNTGADYDKILIVDSKSVNDYYQPKISWLPLENKGREMEESTLDKVSKDYLASYFHLQEAMRTGEISGLHDHFTENIRESVGSLINDQTEKQQSRGTTISHVTRLDFYSVDGTIITLTDQVVSFKKLMNEGNYAFYDTTEYQVMLLLEDNFWRVRHSVKGDFYDESIANNRAVRRSDKNLFSFGTEDTRIRGLNYYPQNHPWQEMWSVFDSTTLKEDLHSIRNLGFNTIRVFIPFHEFGGPQPLESELAKIQELLDQSEKENIKVIVTLFDFFLGYPIEEWTLSDRHAEVIVNAIKDHPALLAWDVKNEPDLDYENVGKEEVNDWLKFMIKRIRGYDSETPITIGWSQPEAMIALQEHVDFLSFHYYRNPTELMDILKEVNSNKPLFLGETGMHSFEKWWYPFKKSEEDQLVFYQEIGQVISEMNLHYAFWTLYDFKAIPSNVAGKWPWQKGPQKSYGIINQEDGEKPSYQWIKTFNHLKNEK